MRKNDLKKTRILIDAVKYHLVPHIYQKKKTKNMFGVLKKLFENSNINGDLSLRKQLSNIKMTKSDSVACYFMNISEIRDQLNTIRELIEDRELIMMNLYGFPSSWEPFI